MKTSSHFNSKVKKNFEKFFDKSVIDKTAKSSGFFKRKAKKISAFNFVLGFILWSSKQHNTSTEWAIQIGMIIKKKLSRQGTFDRIPDKAAVFARQLLQKLMAKQRCDQAKPPKGLSASFGKVLVQGSTTL